MTKEQKDFQAVLDYACKQGRWLGGHEFYGAVLPCRPEVVVEVVQPKVAWFRESTKGGKSVEQLVYEFHNGHVVESRELQSAFPKVSPKALSKARSDLTRRGLFRKVGHGAYQRIK